MNQDKVAELILLELASPKLALERLEHSAATLLLGRVVSGDDLELVDVIGDNHLPDEVESSVTCDQVAD